MPEERKVTAAPTALFSSWPPALSASPSLYCSSPSLSTDPFSLHHIHRHLQLTGYSSRSMATASSHDATASEGLRKRTTQASPANSSRSDLTERASPALDKDRPEAKTDGPQQQLPKVLGRTPDGTGTSPTPHKPPTSLAHDTGKASAVLPRLNSPPPVWPQEFRRFPASALVHALPSPRWPHSALRMCAGSDSVPIRPQ